jgi:hypothetical protein
VVEVRNSAANHFGDVFFSGNQTVVVDSESKTAGTFSIKRLVGDIAKDNEYSASGILDDGSGHTFDVKAIAKGGDLAVESIDITPRLAPCKPLSLDAETIRCHAAAAALKVTAGAFSTGLSLAYRGKLIRDLGKPETVVLTVGDRPLSITAVVRRISAVDRSLKVDAALTFGSQKQQ